MNQRFTVQKLSPDGAVGMGSAIMLVLAAFVTAAVLGFAASFVGQWF